MNLGTEMILVTHKTVGTHNIVSTHKIVGTHRIAGTSCRFCVHPEDYGYPATMEDKLSEVLSWKTKALKYFHGKQTR